MKAWSLEAVIDPVGKEDFFSAYFESQRLLVRRNRPDYFEELLTLDDVDRILTTAQSTREEVAVVNAANKIKTTDYVYGNDRVKVDQLFRLHEAGGTIILNHLHRRHPPLARLCAALELEFSAPSDCDRGAFSKAFAELAGRLATDVDADEIRRGFAERFIDRRPPFLRHQMRALTQIGDIGLDSIVGCRPFLAYLLDEDQESLIVRFHRNEIAVPLHAGPAVRHALTTERFRVRDLPGDLDDAGKLVLVRRLIREGLLQPLDQTQI